MKKLLTFLLLIPLSLAAVSWDDDYEYALESAKEENKLVLLMFPSQTCKVCKYMKSKVYPQKVVSDYISENFIPVEIDINEYPESFGYKVLGTPTYYFLSAQGTVIGQAMIGGAKAKAFLNKLKEVKKSTKK